MRALLRNKFFFPLNSGSTTRPTFQTHRHFSLSVSKPADLKPQFIEQYKGKEKFEFNGLGELAYLRSYSWIQDNGTKEQWKDTVARVVKGTLLLLERHCEKQGISSKELTESLDP